MHRSKKLLAATSVALSITSATLALALASPANAAATLSVTLSAAGTGASAVYNSAGDPVLTVGSPSTTTFAEMTVNTPPTAAPASAPTLTTNNYNRGSPRWFIKFAGGDQLFGYPSQAGTGTSNWTVITPATGTCHSAAPPMNVTYTAALTFITTAGCDSSVTGAGIIADGGQVAGTSDTITNVSYDGMTLPGLTATYTGALRLFQLGLCLDDRLGRTSNGAIVQVWRCNGRSTQTFEVMTDGTIRHDGLCLDASGFGTTSRTKVQLWACTGGANQKWDTKGWRIHYDNPHAVNQVLDDSGFGGSGTQQEIFTNNGGRNQVWGTS
jgi:hypothetical protein